MKTPPPLVDMRRFDELVQLSVKAAAPAENVNLSTLVAVLPIEIVEKLLVELKVTASADPLGIAPPIQLLTSCQFPFVATIFHVSLAAWMDGDIEQTMSEESAK